MCRVLSVSYDPILLETRRALLTSAQFEVTSALGTESALWLCKKEQFDLLLIGHTVPLIEKAKLTQCFRTYCGGSVLAMHRASQDEFADADYVFNSSDNPNELLSLVSRILAAQRTSHNRKEHDNASTENGEHGQSQQA